MLNCLTVWLLLGAITSYYVLFKLTPKDIDEQNTIDDLKFMMGDVGIILIIGFCLLSLLSPMMIPDLIIRLFKKRL